MAQIIGVRFKEAGRTYYFDPGKTMFKKGDHVIVETAWGVECGEVERENCEIPDEQIVRELKPIIRAATEEDHRTLARKAVREAEALRIAEEKVARLHLEMKLVSVEYTFDSSKIIIHFKAEHRVDFRQLVRDLAAVFHTRIELRQLGGRDQTKLLGGLGICGRPYCCNSFMGDFHPVSIKMAKEQGLSLNPTKISGTCGRLLCCLQHEEAAYEDASRRLPRAGDQILTPDGQGIVQEVNPISSALRVRVDGTTATSTQYYIYDQETNEVKRKPTTLREGLTSIPKTPMVSQFDFDEEEEQEQHPKNEKNQRQQQGGKQGGQNRKQDKKPSNPQQHKGQTQHPQQRQPKAQTPPKQPRASANDTRELTRYTQVDQPLRRATAEKEKKPQRHHWQKKPKKPNLPPSEV
ncbi:MAG: stage 0 sporulation family protein [Oscillospiraceae bacterium]|jgi:cell fate regulator YaaT (PSP1 superfamily)|nr:stage 0 sporulation family protein [Oscillospiraceae bacterium]